ncbi:MAG: PspC domain-containing protein [Pseudobacteriovorax sp.]|nr:PspC domain-containing protein [Pseudobacteriovorax sp.]
MTDFNRRFYRLPEKGVFTGVTAGIADSYDIPVNLMRIGLVLIVLTGVLPVAFAYIALGFVLPIGKSAAKPSLADTRSQQKIRDNRSYQVRHAEQVLNRCKRRLNALESYMVSNRYRLDQEYRKLEKDV